MRSPPNTWPNTSGARGVLLFAQLLREMLAPDTFESFRVFSLDTPSRLRETIKLYHDLSQGRITRNTSRPALSEALWSIENDPIVRENVDSHIMSTLKDSLQKADDNATILHTLNYIDHLISEKYKSAIEQKIIDSFAVDNRRHDFRVMVGFYCSHIVNIGYSRQFIAHKVDDMFFSRPISRAGESQIRAFFSIFDSKIITYNVFTTTTGDILPMLNINMYNIHTSVSLPVRSYSQDLVKELPAGPQDKYLESTLTALDPDAAAAKLNQMLSYLKALSMLSGKRVDVKWNERMYVVPYRSHTGTVSRLAESPLEWINSNTKTSNRLHKRISKNIDRIATSFDHMSISRILNSVSTATIGRSNSNADGQLISLWSAVEVLLSDPPQGSNRIDHYTGLLTPCICMRHIRRKTSAVFDQLVVDYRRKFMRIIDSVHAYSEVDPHTKFAAAMYIPEYEQLRTDLLNMAKANPLALNRLSKLHKDYSTPTELLKSIASHESRVSWQLNRIYRARNFIVHAGEKPPFLTSVVINMNEYYLAALYTVLRHAGRYKNPSDIDQIVSEIGIKYKSNIKYIMSIKKNDVLSDEDFRKIFI